MLANGVKETTTTTGTGAVTLSAVTGYPRFADSFSANDLVYYAIQSGNNWEWGIGTIGAGNTLARTVVRATYNSGVYSESSPSPITLAGVSSVFVARDAGCGIPDMPAVASTLHASGHAVSVANTTLAAVADRLYAVPFLLTHNRPIAQLCVSISTAAAAKKIRLGMYSIGANGLPDKLIAQTADIDASSTGLKSSSISAGRVKPGWYYMSLISDGTPTVRAKSEFAGNPLGNMGSAFSYMAVHRFAPITAGWSTLPATYPTAGADVSEYAAPHILVNVGS